MSGHRKVGRPNFRWSDVTQRHEEMDAGRTKPENMENENLMSRPQRLKRKRLSTKMENTAVFTRVSITNSSN